MLITLKYDLTRKIDEANRRVKIRYISIDSLSSTKYFLVSTPIATAINPKEITLLDTSKIVLFAHLIRMIVEAAKSVSNIEHRQIIARDQLNSLSLNLNRNGIKTSGEILPESIHYSTEYSVRLNENKLPEIVQNKYVYIPTYDNGKISQESIAQEHTLGTDDYILTSGSPAKSYKLALNTN